uniref:C2H2-type domain-containing protein n=1 Tax=Ditylenchus dipsaci TaxID=166011 RepID=A0A915EQM7_9BILA
MSAYSADSPSQEQKTPKKRSWDPVWDNYTEVNDLGELKMRCSQCQQIFTKPKTSLTSHWEHRHKDHQQPAKKIRASVAAGSTEPNEK